MGVVAKRGVVEQVRGMLQTYPSFLIPKLGKYADDIIDSKCIATYCKVQ